MGIDQTNVAETIFHHFNAERERDRRRRKRSPTTKVKRHDINRQVHNMRKCTNTKKTETTKKAFDIFFLTLMSH